MAIIKKKAAMGMQTKPNKKTYPLLGIETPTPGSINGQRGVPLDKKIQADIKSGKINKDGSSKTPIKKMGGAMKKAKMGTSLGMKSVKAGYDDNSGVTRADFVSIGKGKAKMGKAVKKCRYGCK
jgi:hypothetical protein